MCWYWTIAIVVVSMVICACTALSMFCDEFIGPIDQGVQFCCEILMILLIDVDADRIIVVGVSDHANVYMCFVVACACLLDVLGDGP